MKHKYLFILIIAFSCTKKSFTLDGKIHGNSAKYIYLTYGKVKDSSVILNNEFHFKGKASIEVRESIVLPLLTI